MSNPERPNIYHVWTNLASADMRKSFESALTEHRDWIRYSDDNYLVASIQDAESIFKGLKTTVNSGGSAFVAKLALISFKDGTFDGLMNPALWTWIKQQAGMEKGALKAKEIMYANMRRQLQSVISPLFENPNAPNGAYASKIRQRIVNAQAPFLQQKLVFEVEYYLPCDWETHVRAEISYNGDGITIDINSPIGSRSIDLVRMDRSAELNDSDVAGIKSLIEQHLTAATSAVEVVCLNDKQIVVGELKRSIISSDNSKRLAMVSKLHDVELKEGSSISFKLAGRNQATFEVLEVSETAEGNLQMMLRPFKLLETSTSSM